MVAMLTACDEQFSDLPQNCGKDEIFVATIAGSASADTRVAISPTDGWSYTRFDNTADAIGFYSLYGNLDDESQNGPFVNGKMVYARGEAGNRPDDRYWRGVFRPVDMNYDVGLIKNELGKTFVYFPYTDRMEAEGMELRRQMADGTYRCVDALAISQVSANDDAVMSGTFIHTFAEVVILRGYGFDAPPAGRDGIKVVTTEPYSHAKVVDNTNSGHTDWKILKPIYDPEHTTLTEQECREWEAWDGAPYVDDYNKSFPAKYVIIPTAISGDRSTVNYVELYDNNGTLHKVTTFGLMNVDNKRVSPNERYWLTIKLEGLVPTIYPFAITPWADETRYTDQRARGINTPSEFMQFVLDYNNYNQNSRSENLEDPLKNYGDRYVTDGHVGWHFHINNDIDLSDSPFENLRIETLCDTIDGRTKTLQGIKGKTAFIDELQSQGCIRNLNVTGLNVNTEDDVAGGLVNRMTGGLIMGCSVDGFINAKGAVGLAVGQFTAGTIRNSSFSGLVVGASSYEKKGLIGKGPTSLGPEMLVGVNTSGLLFTPIGN